MATLIKVSYCRTGYLDWEFVNVSPFGSIRISALLHIIMVIAIFMVVLLGCVSRNGKASKESLRNCANKALEGWVSTQRMRTNPLNS